LSPLHIGTGEETDAVYSEQKRSKLNERLGKAPLVSMVMKDGAGKPIIPGSALKGIIRHWLLNILVGISPAWAMTRDFEGQDLTDLSQDKQIEKVKSEFSWLEVLFGTPFHEGKIEVWDACCLTKSMPAPDGLLHWNDKSLTYIDTSVAIDPATGTAIEHLLYKTEVVPPGVLFDFNLAGQNLSETELGLILLALQGFNSTIYPIRIGARGGRGYGRVQFIPGPVYRLKQENVKDWIKSANEGFSLDQSQGDSSASKFEGKDVGYYTLPQLSEAEQKKLITDVKAELNKILSESAKS
jgi:CRISPR/Cas system CSM-associated protein Csm3 (group 7 of RAMP superfamily)